MSITTYTELSTTIATWLHRSDLTASIPDFIQLAEDEINTDMRLRLMEVDIDLTLVSGTRVIDLPVRFLEPVQLQLLYPLGSDNRALTYQSPSQMVVNESPGVSCWPEFWGINGDSIEFPNLADRDYSLTFRFLQGFSLATTSTNSLLDSYRGIYLYGALKHSAPWLANDARIATWSQMYEQLKAKVNKKESRSKSLTMLQTELGGRRRSSNILRGW